MQINDLVKIQKIEKQPQIKIISSSNIKKSNILLANDDPFLLHAYENMLEMYFTVTTAENGL